MGYAYIIMQHMLIAPVTCTNVLVQALFMTLACRSWQAYQCGQTVPECDRQLIRRDELRAAWAAFTPLLHAVDAGELAPLPYAAGTRGPSEADVLAAKAGFVKTATYVWKDTSFWREASL